LDHHSAVYHDVQTKIQATNKFILLKGLKVEGGERGGKGGKGREREGKGGKGREREGKGGKGRSRE
jgi:hypothetical protein